MPAMTDEKPAAFRAYFADVRWAGFYRDENLLRDIAARRWYSRYSWWLHAKRLEAVELFGGPVVATVRPTFIEFRPEAS